MHRHVIKIFFFTPLVFSLNAFAYYGYDQYDDEAYYRDDGYGTHQYYQNNSGYYDQYAQNNSGKKYKNKRGYGFPSSRPATGRSVFIYNPRTLTWAAYSPSGELVKTGPGSGGAHYCRDVRRGCRTPSGTFSVYSKQGPYFRSSKYPVRTNGGAPMPYAMFFHRGFAIHGSNEVRSFNASHGCIRILPGDARWLSTRFLNYGSTVIVYPY